jgi:hypothetical protein
MENYIPNYQLSIKQLLNNFSFIDENFESFKKSLIDNRDESKIRGYETKIKHELEHQLKILQETSTDCRVLLYQIDLDTYNIKDDKLKETIKSYKQKTEDYINKLSQEFFPKSKSDIEEDNKFEHYLKIHPPGDIFWKTY